MDITCTFGSLVGVRDSIVIADLGMRMRVNVKDGLEQWGIVVDAKPSERARRFLSMHQSFFFLPRPSCLRLPVNNQGEECFAKVHLSDLDDIIATVPRRFGKCLPKLMRQESSTLPTWLTCQRKDFLPLDLLNMTCFGSSSDILNPPFHAPCASLPVSPFIVQCLPPEYGIDFSLRNSISSVLNKFVNM